MAAVAAVGWGVGIAVVQPATEPTRIAENNDYWARDARLMLITLALCAFVWAVRGDRLLGPLGLAGAFVWLGADIALDRAGLAGTTAAVAASAVAAGAVATAWFLASRRARRPARAPLVLASAVAATVAGIGCGVQSPTDTEAALTVSGFMLGLLGVAVSLGCAYVLTPASRWSLLTVGAAAVALAVLSRLSSPGPLSLPLGILLTTLLLAVVTMRAMGARSASAWIGSVVGSLTLLVLIGMTTIMLGLFLPLGEPLTALAGSPPVNAADEDVLLTAVAVLTGLGTGGAIAKMARVAADPWPESAAT
ncbi:hypothetical protein Pen01_02990 [Phytomonospora endophytica]|nr:hypothetical protein Pen01_02990 [Phytomonospora endophytica]